MPHKASFADVTMAFALTREMSPLRRRRRIGLFLGVELVTRVAQGAVCFREHVPSQLVERCRRAL